MEAIICSNVNKSYGKKEVLKNIDFTLEKGKIYGLIGRNGAGKTTLLSILSAQNPATEGNVTWNGEKIWENRKALDHICFSRELSTNLYGSGVSSLKVKEYLKNASYYYPNWDQKMADGLIEKFELNTKQRINKMSKGMLSMVTIIVALASKAVPFRLSTRHGTSPRRNRCFSVPPRLIRDRPRKWRQCPLP